MGFSVTFQYDDFLHATLLSYEHIKQELLSTFQWYWLDFIEFSNVHTKIHVQRRNDEISYKDNEYM